MLGNLVEDELLGFEAIVGDVREDEQVFVRPALAGAVEEAEGGRLLLDDTKGLAAVAGDETDGRARQGHDGSIAPPRGVDRHRAVPLLEEPAQVVASALALHLPASEARRVPYVLEDAARRGG